ncbi:MAG: hypothetical protein ACK4N5_18005, partial [Myxococcales bacterium]
MIPSAVVNAGLSLVLLAAVFWPLERLFAARPGQPWLRRGWATDLAFFFGQYLLWSAAALWVLSAFAERLEPALPAAPRAAFAALPFAAQALLVVKAAIAGSHTGD